MSYTKIHPAHFNTIVDLSNRVSLIQRILEQDSSKMNRIQGSANYSRAISYYFGTSNISQILHTGNTSIGLETITEVFTYVDPNVEGSNLLNIVYQ
jgi:hypothetical protein